MAAKDEMPNPLLITGKAPDASLAVQLHPLVLLTISDYITRHTLRSQEGPIVGAVIGQQDGRHFTLEHAFQCRLAEQRGDVVLDSEWFTDRLEQYREVHKAPALDLVALFALGPVDGPQKVHLPVLKQVQHLTGNDGILLLLFHGELMDKLQGGKLPISLYESVRSEQEGGELRFREMSFEVETGEAEMIAVDTVAKGGSTAVAVQKADTTTTTAAASPEGSRTAKGKGKGKTRDKQEEEGELNTLSPEDDELIASLTAKSNAIKMLNDRINLIRSYLETVPSSQLTDASSTTPPSETTNHPVLRSINALLSRIPLLSPPVASIPTQPTTSDSNGHGTVHIQPPTSQPTINTKEALDVHLTSLLAALTRSVAEASAMGSKFHVVSRERENKARNDNFGGGGGGGNGGFPGGRGAGMMVGSFGDGEWSTLDASEQEL
ncbi:hypothetical protein LTR62_002939 [Meristemomyces frigidus]|uniref:COP9 signalosome complex subunit 6 n=1 Tax=Meristemomyces frigidus TaxID=1508187 RepID=A0AAN7TX61_9PEZI|nr:hypothetical protein LTR62_002939 [Meristemomyces frigidus]